MNMENNVPKKHIDDHAFVVAQSLAYEVKRIPVTECTITQHTLLQKLAEYHCEHNGLDLTNTQIDELIEEALITNSSIQATIDCYAFEHELF